ncbi:hypothetical protein HYALB_00003911 [Hymenoscyphus albidus]|uniref:3beta-hydroxysteroid 3-dehydrogenase n=1 Tax=Hymenoscyphus albidus TaxID=595503 RepID=A0A9N9Q4R1_9HELO|nr:hypothetical protein HYALB_00003911 [Hymenoscyphus albidus]
MSGTIIITGANGSLAVPSVEYLLSHYPDYTAILTVRNTSDSDENTARLKQTIARFPKATTSIRKLDLSSLADVQEFATTISSEIATGSLGKIAAVICNAYIWSINDGLRFSQDKYELSFAVNHLAHMSLVLRLLGSFRSDGRIVFLASDAHYPGKNGLEKYPPGIPDNIELLVKPEPDTAGEEVGRGFQRYGNSKLAVIMGTYELNRRLQQDPNLKDITAVALDPGGLPDSKAMRSGVPGLWKYGMKVLGAFQPIMKYAIPTLRSAKLAAVDLIELAVGKKYIGTKGFYEMSEPSQSSPESNDETKQQKLWTKTLEWAHMTKDDASLTTAF